MRITLAWSPLTSVLACLMAGSLGLATPALASDDRGAGTNPKDDESDEAPAAWQELGIVSWAFYIADVSDDDTLRWRMKPAQLRHENTETSAADDAVDDEPTTWWRVAVPDAPDARALVQHGGAIVTFDRPVPADAPLRLAFRAKHVDGAAQLTVHRRWGGSRPSAPIRLADQWETHTLVMRTEAYETESLSFNLKQDERPHFGPYERGTFLIADVCASFAGER